jgi:hypothetical protein
MKKILSFSLLACIVLTFYGCPLGLDYSLGTTGTEAIDPELIGTWTIKKGQEGEAMKLTIVKKDEQSYSVEILKRGENYSLGTDHLTGWVTTVGGEKFFYLQPSDENTFYHYHYEMKDKKTMIIHDVSLLDGGTEAVSSTETLRAQVERSISKEGWGQEKLEYIRK